MLNQLKLENLNSIQNNLHGDNNLMFKDLKQNEFNAQNQNNNQVVDMKKWIYHDNKSLSGKTNICN